MNRSEQKENNSQEKEQASPSQSSLPGGVPSDEDVGQGATQSVPSYLSSSASAIATTGNDYLHSLASSNQIAANAMPQTLYSNLLQASAHSTVPFFQEGALQPLVVLSPSYGINSYLYLGYQQPLQALIDPRQPLNHSQYLPGHFHGLAGGMQAAYPAPSADLWNATPALQYAEQISAQPKVEEVQTVSAVTTSSNDNEASTDSIKSEIIAKPKRPLSAYNLFFQAERQQIIQKEDDNGDDERKRKRSGISFESLGKEIGERWKQIDAETLRHYEDLARADKDRYLKEMERYKAQQDSEMTKRRMQLESTVPEETMELYMKSQSKKPKKKKTRRK